MVFFGATASHLFPHGKSLKMSGFEQLEKFGVLTINKKVLRKEDLLNTSVHDIWPDLTSKLQSKTLCVKPARDGCSTGVARLW